MTGTEKMTQSVRAHHRVSRRNLRAELAAGFRLVLVRQGIGKQPYPFGLIPPRRPTGPRQRTENENDTEFAKPRTPERKPKGNLPRGTPPPTVTLRA
jgi:hypothetical protein